MGENAAKKEMDEGELGSKHWENGEKRTYERDHPCGSTTGHQGCWLLDHCSLLYILIKPIPNHFLAENNSVCVCV